MSRLGRVRPWAGMKGAGALEGPGGRSTAGNEERTPPGPSSAPGAFGVYASSTDTAVSKRRVPTTTDRKPD
ncbi:hypothetical protein ACFQHN_02060 [Natrialbaceae archaeon GCM10025896]